MGNFAPEPIIVKNNKQPIDRQAAATLLLSLPDSQRLKIDEAVKAKRTRPEIVAVVRAYVNTLDEANRIVDLLLVIQPTAGDALSSHRFAAALAILDSTTAVYENGFELDLDKPTPRYLAVEISGSRPVLGLRSATRPRKPPH